MLLQMEPGKWVGWIMTGSDEMAKLVDEQLQETADWENNLKALKVSVLGGKTAPKYFTTLEMLR